MEFQIKHVEMDLIFIIKMYFRRDFETGSDPINSNSQFFASKYYQAGAWMSITEDTFTFSIENALSKIIYINIGLHLFCTFILNIEHLIQ